MGIGVLRVFLALSVVMAHVDSLYGYRMLNGVVAVQSFYIISGFYMTMILTEKYSDIYYFYTNRLLRLYPIYWVVLFCTMFLSYFSLIGGGWELYKEYNLSLFSLFFLLVSNIFMIGQDMVMFMGLNPDGQLFFCTDFSKTAPRLYTFLFVPQAWTIGVEILFYIVAPFVVRRKISFIIGIILISFISRYFIYSYGLNHDPWTYRFFLNEFSLFFMGVLSYRIYKIFKGKISGLSMKIALNYIFMFTIVYVWIPMEDVYKHWIYCFSIFITLPFVFHYSKYNWKDRKIGELSYPIYISHMLVVYISSVGIINRILFYVGIPVNVFVLILSVVISMILYQYVQMPIERFRESRVELQK